MMKLLVLIFIIFSISAKAEEYYGYLIKLKIEKTNGEKIIGHTSIGRRYLNKDSLQNTEYLKKTLTQFNSVYNDSFTYYKHRIRYLYDTRYYEGEKQDTFFKDTIYHLAQKVTISLQSIKNITIDELVNFNYFTSVVNDLKISDTSWLKKKPVKTLSVDGYLCDYMIIVHKNSKQINELAKQLEQKQKEKVNLESPKDEDEYIDEAIRRKVDDDLRKVDADVDKITQELKNQKVVVIANCLD